MCKTKVPDFWNTHSTLLLFPTSSFRMTAMLILITVDKLKQTKVGGVSKRQVWEQRFLWRWRFLRPDTNARTYLRHVHNHPPDYIHGATPWKITT
jgi:hypothetical protein